MRKNASSAACRPVRRDDGFGPGPDRPQRLHEGRGQRARDFDGGRPLQKIPYPEGPTYIVPVKDLAYIRYANGETERYAVPAEAAPAARSAEAAPTARRYEIGDLYEADGVRGIVRMVSEDGMHGLALSLDEIYLPWSGFRKPDLRVVGATDRGDGRVNMRIVEEYIAANGLSWDDFPPPSSGAARRAKGGTCPRSTSCSTSATTTTAAPGGIQPQGAEVLQRTPQGGRRQADGPSGKLLLLDGGQRAQCLYVAHEHRASLCRRDPEVRQVPRAGRACLLNRRLHEKKRRDLPGGMSRRCFCRQGGEEWAVCP